MRIITKTFIASLILIANFNASAQKDKTKSFEVVRIIEAPASEVWRIVGEEYADIAKSHPKLASSHYVEGTPMNGEGCERVCNINEEGTKYTKEKIVDYNLSDFSFKADISHVGGLPLVADKSYMLYDIDPIDDNSCKIKFTMVYLTDPAFLGALAKGKFKKGISDYALAIEHHVLTGEDVGPDNFKEIKKQYSN